MTGALVYSRWRPDSGGYDYFESSYRQNINDDLPAPELTLASKIGVPSIEAGRPIPAGSQPAGSGDEPIGLIAPVDSRRIVRRSRPLGETEVLGVPRYGWFFMAFAAMTGAVLYAARDKW